ncbi:MAG: tyrosine-type recombinase/integrase [Acidimicrobiia bacterium]
MARGSVSKRGSTWTIVLDVGPDPVTGRRRQKSKGGFRTRKAAEAGLRELSASVDAGQFVERSTKTVGEYLDEWLEVVQPRLRPTTWNSYRQSVAHIKGRIGAVPLQSLAPLEVENLYKQLLATSGRQGRLLSSKTVRGIHVVLRKALADAERLGLVARNAAAAAKPPVPDKYEHRTWTAEQLARFLDSIERERLAAAFVLLATTGMRRGEALGLRWGDVDLTAGRLSIVQTITTVRDKAVFSPPKTSRSRRSVSLDPVTFAALRDHRRRQNEERLRAGEAWSGSGDLVFTNEVGEPVHPSALSRLFVSSVRASGLPMIRLHDLRHTYATVALAAGVHPKIVSERLGHATIAVTLDLYSHVTPAIDAEAAALVASKIFDHRGTGEGER